MIKKYSNIIYSILFTIVSICSNAAFASDFDSAKFTELAKSMTKDEALRYKKSYEKILSDLEEIETKIRDYDEEFSNEIKEYLETRRNAVETRILIYGQTDFNNREEIDPSIIRQAAKYNPASGLPNQSNINDEIKFLHENRDIETKSVEVEKKIYDLKLSLESKYTEAKRDFNQYIADVRRSAKDASHYVTVYAVEKGKKQHIDKKKPQIISKKKPPIISKKKPPIISKKKPLMTDNKRQTKTSKRQSRPTRPESSNLSQDLINSIIASQTKQEILGTIENIDDHSIRQGVVLSLAQSEDNSPISDCIQEMIGLSEDEYNHQVKNYVYDIVNSELIKRNIEPQKSFEVRVKLLSELPSLISQIEKAKSEYDKKVREEKRKAKRQLVGRVIITFAKSFLATALNSICPVIGGMVAEIAGDVLNSICFGDKFDLGNSLKNGIVAGVGGGIGQGLGEGVSSLADGNTAKLLLKGAVSGGIQNSLSQFTDPDKDFSFNEVLISMAGGAAGSYVGEGLKKLPEGFERDIKDKTANFILNTMESAANGKKINEETLVMGLASAMGSLTANADVIQDKCKEWRQEYFTNDKNELTPTEKLDLEPVDVQEEQSEVEAPNTNDQLSPDLTDMADDQIDSNSSSSPDRKNIDECESNINYTESENKNASSFNAPVDDNFACLSSVEEKQNEIDRSEEAKETEKRRELEQKEARRKEYDELKNQPMGPDEASDPTIIALVNEFDPHIQNPSEDEHCFTGDTLIQVVSDDDSDNKTRPISEMLEGDLVWSCDIKGQSCVKQKIVKLFEHVENKIVHIELNDEEVRTTVKHPFFVLNKNIGKFEWKEAGRILAGDTLLNMQKEGVHVKSAWTENQSELVYNFHVRPLNDYNLAPEFLENFNNYYVSSAGILVHNCNGPAADAGDRLGTGSMEAGAEGALAGAGMVDGASTLLGVGGAGLGLVKRGIKYFVGNVAKKEAKDTVKKSIEKGAAKYGGSKVGNSNAGANPQLGLPAGPKIKAEWSAKKYRHGGETSTIEHVMYRHSHESGFSNVSRFSQGTKARDVKYYVDNALRNGDVIPNGPGGFKVEMELGKNIGTTKQGDPTSKIRVLVRDGTIQSVFPIDP